MVIRRHLAWTVLIALTLAALSGVMAILTTAGNEYGRLAGTFAIVAIAAIVMTPMAVLAEKPETRLAGQLGACIVIAELVIVGFLLWAVGIRSNLREFLGWTTLIIGPPGLIAARFLQALRRPGQRWTAIVGAAGCVIAAAAWIVAAWFETFGGNQNRAFDFFESAWTLFGAGFVCAITFIGFGQPPLRRWRWFGVAAAGVAAGMAVFLALEGRRDRPAWVVCPLSVAAVFAHAIYILRPRLTPGQAWIRYAAMAVTACTAALVTTCYTTDSRGVPYLDTVDWLGRVTAALVLLSIGASLGVASLASLNRRPKLRLAKTTIYSHVAVICPRCAEKQVLPLGGALCGNCRLHISITVHTARCAQCEYDLTGISAAVCPECGTALPVGPTHMTAPPG